MKSIVEGGLRESQKPHQIKATTKDKELESVLGAHKTVIRIIGTGGAGNNTITRLMEVGIKGIEAIAVNTDAQDLLYANADNKILIGKNITNGLGAGSDPQIGEDSAKENQEDLKKALEGSDMVFVTCGLGGGTGTGSVPIIAEVAKSCGALTIAVITLPFTEEGILRWENARRGLEKLEMSCDTIIVIQNDKLFEIAPDLPLEAAFKVSDEILVNAVKGITELVTEKGLINLDFADIRAIMKNGGTAMIGIGESDSENKAIEAVEQAIKNPLLDVDITGATSALINITGGKGMSLKDAKTIMQLISQKLDPEARVIWGACIDQSMNETLRVMLIVTGLKTKKFPQFQEKTRRIRDEIKDFREVRKPIAKQDETKISKPDKGLFDIKETKPIEEPKREDKRSKKVFIEIFRDEAQADLNILGEAVTYLGNGKLDTKVLKDIKNACLSLRNTAQLFDFEKIEALAGSVVNFIEKALTNKTLPSETLMSAIKEVPEIIKRLMYEEEEAFTKAKEIMGKLNESTPDLPELSLSNNPKSKSHISSNPNKDVTQVVKPTSQDDLETGRHKASKKNQVVDLVVGEDDLKLTETNSDITKVEDALDYVKKLLDEQSQKNLRVQREDRVF